MLTAIAGELQRDEEAAAQAGEGTPAGGAMAQADGVVASTALDPAELQAPAPDPAGRQAAASAPAISGPASPGAADSRVPALDPAASAPTVWSPVPRPADLPLPDPDREAHQAAASAPTVWSPVPRPAPDQAVHRARDPDLADLQALAAQQPDPQPVPHLPRRTPGTNGAPPPPAHVRRNFLPPSLLAHRLDLDIHTEPLPKITGFRTGSDADPAAAATLPAGAPSLLPLAPGAAPPDSGQAGAAFPAGVFPEPAAPPDLTRQSPSSADQASPTAPAAPGPAGPATPAPTVSPGAPGYPWQSDQHGKRPGNGAAVTAPGAPSAGKKRQGSGRRYRVAGLLVAVIALVAAAVIAFLLSGRTGTTGNGHGGMGAPGAGAGERNLAAAWVAGQVSRTAVVACDPVMCRALAAHGVPARLLYPLGSAISPLHSKIIVATAQVRAQYGNLLSSVYAPAVLASFGSGPQRVEIRQTAPHGAAAYRAMLGADLLSRKTSGAELLHSNRIATAPIARQELSAGRVDPRLLIAIAEMATVHPMYIFNFGSAAPGADPSLPLRFADLTETGRAHGQVGWSAGYVRSVMSFLHAQRFPFRPAHMATVYLVGGTKALRIEFPAPSPLGLLGPHRA